MNSSSHILVIQTAFIGDVILASALLESLHQKFPDGKIDIVVRQGNEGLFLGHPFLNKVYTWNKKENKIKNLFTLIKEIRKRKYDYIFNLQRFFSSGIITLMAKGKVKVGFDKNPLSFFFTNRIKHRIGDGRHEVERNAGLITGIFGKVDEKRISPRLYPSDNDFKTTYPLKGTFYICVAPASVWFTKQFPVSAWIEFLNKVPENIKVYILGSPGDTKLAAEIVAGLKRKGVENLSGKLSFLESAALMRDALMNYVNDSAPLHIASSMDAPVAAIFCSTIPEFGFGPLSTKSVVIQAKEKLACRPCGLHGKRKCPEGHFKCGYNIEINDMLLYLK